MPYAGADLRTNSLPDEGPGEGDGARSLDATACVDTERWKHLRSTRSRAAGRDLQDLSPAMTDGRSRRLGGAPASGNAAAGAGPMRCILLKRRTPWTCASPVGCCGKQVTKCWKPTAVRGRAHTARLHSGAIHLVLTDVMMPGGFGRDPVRPIRHIRRQSPWSSCRLHRTTLVPSGRPGAGDRIPAKARSPRSPARAGVRAVRTWTAAAMVPRRA